MILYSVLSLVATIVRLYDILWGCIAPYTTNNTPFSIEIPAQNRINLDKSVTKVVLAVETVMVWGGILLHVVEGGYGTHVGALELR